MSDQETRWQRYEHGQDKGWELHDGTDEVDEIPDAMIDLLPPLRQARAEVERLRDANDLAKALIADLAAAVANRDEALAATRKKIRPDDLERLRSIFEDALREG